MSEAARGDVRISGSGSIATGKYATVSIAGSATMTGDVECENFKVSGAADGSGTLKAQSITVSGSLGYGGDAEAGKVRVNGSGSFGGLKAQDLSISGTLSARELVANTVKVQGLLKVGGDCQAERFVTQGAFEVDGLLNAGVVDVMLGGKCRAGEIGGESIVVRIGVGAVKRFLTSLIPGLELRLTAESIEGDDVRLEYTTAMVVRGKTVVIGPESAIGLVEYTESYTASPDAKVTEARKVVTTGEAGTTTPEGA